MTVVASRAKFGRGIGSKGVTLRLFTAAAVLLSVAVISSRYQPARAAGTPVTITLTIQRFVEIDDPDTGIFEQSHGEYYAIADIGGTGSYQDTRNLGYSEQHNAPDITPYWRFTKTVDSSLGTVPINFQVKDDDTGVPGTTDDVMDINPVSGQREMHISFNLQTGDWTGDNGGVNNGFSQGNGDSERGKVLFDVGFNDDNSAKDGIPDGVKHSKVYDTNGNVVADMAALGADPCRPTIAMQIDYMQGAADGHTHKPKASAIADVQQAFANAPTSGQLAAVQPCHYAGYPNGKGVDLVIDVANAIPEQPVVGIGSDYTTIRQANFNSARQPYFHYALFVHDQKAGSSSSGLCCENKKNILISLGSWRTTCIGAGPDGKLDTTPQGDDVVSGTSITDGPDRTCNTTASGDDTQVHAVGGGADEDQVGTSRDQAGSIMHELGHALGLGHGGNEGTNYKPNYLSDMNYSFDPSGIPDPTIGGNRLDYSRSALPQLNEASLNEKSGIGDGTDFTSWYDPALNVRSGQGNQSLDWNWSGNGTTFDSNPVSVDVNNDASCVGPGPDGTLQTTPAGDDVVQNNRIEVGPNRKCETTATGDDTQDMKVNDVEPQFLNGFDDWNNLKLRGALSPNADGAPIEHPELPDPTFEQTLQREQIEHAFFNPDVALTMSVDNQNPNAGDVLTYTATVTNVGTGTATAVHLANTLPDGSASSQTLADLAPGASAARTFTYGISCSTTDQTKLTDSASVTAKNQLNQPEENTSNDSGSATSTVHAPRITLSKTATPSANAGEAVTYTLTYANAGSGGATGVSISDVLPTETYYSRALDQGTGPQPTTVVANADGTTTLTWSIGTVSGSAGQSQIGFTARPSLLLLAGTTKTDNASATFQNANGCTYAPATASAATLITEVPPSRNPLTLGYWRNHPSDWTTEIRARIQATDTGFDSNSDGMLSPSEVQAAFAPPGGTVQTLEWQLLAVYFNLGTRRINADTRITSPTDVRLGLTNVRGAALFALATLDLSPKTNSNRYVQATTVLDEINRNVSEVYS
jgi:uncharacterized repeat protein (TIGR01451 family)